MTDEETFDRVFGRSDWAMMFILACEGQSFARLRFNVGPRAEMEIPVGVDYLRPFAGCDLAAWEQEYLANVHSQQTAHAAASVPELELASPFNEERTDAWYENWFDYVDEDNRLEESCL